jgi:hypothetical protein
MVLYGSKHVKVERKLVYYSCVDGRIYDSYIHGTGCEHNTADFDCTQSHSPRGGNEP